MMFDPKDWISQFDDDSQALAPGQKNSVEFTIISNQWFVPTSILYENLDTITHQILLQLRYQVGPQDDLAVLNIAAGASRLLYPQRTNASNNPPGVVSVTPWFFTGPVTFIISNDTVAATAHSAKIFSRWLQASGKMQANPVTITDVIV